MLGALLVLYGRGSLSFTVPQVHRAAGNPRKTCMFIDFWINCMVFFSKPCFWAFPCKTMQNHLEISSKTQFWTRSVRNWTKTLTSVMSGPAKASPGGQVLVSKAGFPFFCSPEITPFQLLFTNSLFLNKIKSFIKQIYDLLNQMFH